MPGDQTKARLQPPAKFDKKYFMHPDGHIRDTIIIHDTGQTEPPQVFFSLNGFPFLAKKNVEIEVPRPVLEMLQRCRYTLYERQEVSPNTFETVERIVPRFSITIVKRGDEGGEEVAESANG